MLRKKQLLINQTFKIIIKKNIPHGSGLGGGSSNAADLLNILNLKLKLKLTKVKLKKLANKIGFDVPISLEKKIGVNDAFTENSTDNTDIYLQNPMGIDFGTGSTDHEETLFVVNYGRLEITMLDEDDLSYKDHFGDSGVSLFQGAKEAISYVLNDSATTQQANFGLGFWHSASGQFHGFNNDANGNTYDIYGTSPLI